jgi:hypothetical protein
MRKVISILLLFLFLAFAGYGQADGSSYKAEGWPGSSKYASVRNYDDFVKRERALASSGIKISEIGRVTYDKTTYPILAFSYVPPETPKLNVLIVGGQHGNEPAAPEGILTFIKYLNTKPAEYAAVAIDLVPMMNPWGWTHNIRYNGGGYDTNRDFKLFLTGEASTIRDYTKGKTYNLVIDHHEASRDGAFIYSYNDSDHELSNDLMKSLAKNGYAVANISRNSSTQDETGVLHIPGNRSSHTYSSPETHFPFGGNSYSATGRMVLPRYFQTDNPGVHNFTMETSTYKIFGDRSAVHVEVMKFLIKGLLEQ